MIATSTQPNNLISPLHASGPPPSDAEEEARTSAVNHPLSHGSDRGASAGYLAEQYNQSAFLATAHAAAPLQAGFPPAAFWNPAWAGNQPMYFYQPAGKDGTAYPAYVLLGETQPLSKGDDDANDQ
ncbi:hypothetical protein HDU93_008817 [Gonapodya sp. JEL0774]|nr:hypothetical protein HDU93_008817 [Gonapodya sp. JEL0774]